MKERQQSIWGTSIVHGLWSIVSRRRQAAGFTLIELLVAMGILMVIVLMMANLFKQSTLAWETGERQAEAGLEARAVLSMIRNELNQAIGGPGYEFRAEGGTLRFWMAGTPTATNRQADQVVYVHAGSTLRKNGTSLIRNVVAFDVIPSYAPGGDTNGLPLWVDVYLEVGAESDLSQVRISSLGHPDWDADDYRRQLLQSWR